MKKLLLISALFLVVMYPTMVLAGDIYWNSSATFYNDATTLSKARGTASISYSNATWTIKMNFFGLMKNREYIFNISAQDQLNVRYDIPVISDKSGNISKSISINDLTTKIDAFTRGNIAYSQHDIDEGYIGYTILRLFDLSGESGGVILAGVETGPDTNPYLLDNNGDGLPDYPNATMVMRAREDRVYGSLTFRKPR